MNVHQKAVLRRYPHAVSERRLEFPSTSLKYHYYVVWDMSEAHQQSCKRITREAVLMPPRGLIGQGKTEADAWKNAVQTITLQEGKAP